MQSTTETFLLVLPYLLGAALATAIWVWRNRSKSRAAAALRDASIEQGLNEPPSLHPVINASRCIASGGCVTACPEGALGIVDGKAVLVQAAACIGHGACLAACPVDAKYSRDCRRSSGSSRRPNASVIGFDGRSQRAGLMAAASA